MDKSKNMSKNYRVVYVIGKSATGQWTGSFIQLILRNLLLNREEIFGNADYEKVQRTMLHAFSKSMCNIDSLRLSYHLSISYRIISIPFFAWSIKRLLIGLSKLNSLAHTLYKVWIRDKWTPKSNKVCCTIL